MTDELIAAAERERSNSHVLPVAIATTASLVLAAGIIGIPVAFLADMPWLLAPAISAVLLSPILYGIGDIAQSLRKICAKQDSVNGR